MLRRFRENTMVKRRLDPTRCEHPNEVPVVCPCKPGCYCHHGRSCDPRGNARRGSNAGNAGRGSKWISQALRRRIYERDGHACVWCGQRAVSACGLGPEIREKWMFTLDHFIPRSAGGADHPSNLLTSCNDCNAKRRDLPAATWLIQLWPDQGARERAALRVIQKLSEPLPVLQRAKKAA